MLAHLCNSLSWGGQGWLFAGVGSGHEGWSVHRPKCGERARASCRLCLLFGGGHGLSHIAKESEKVAQMYSLGVQQFRTKYVILSEVVMGISTIRQNKAAGVVESVGDAFQKGSPLGGGL